MSEFVKMKKDGAIIEVAPPSVKNHQSLGWVVVEEPAPKAEKPAVEEKAAEEVEAKAPKPAPKKK